MMKKILFAFLVLLLSAENIVHSAPIITFGEDQNIFPGNDVPRIDAFPNSIVAATQFYSYHPGAQVESFGTFPPRSPPPPPFIRFRR